MLQNRGICSALIGALVLLAGCASGGVSGGRGGQGFTAPTPPPLVDAAPLERVNTSGGGQGGSARNAVQAQTSQNSSDAGSAQLGAGLRDLEEEMARMKPGVDRLLEIENDIRILLGQLAAISDAPTPSSVERDQNAALQPLSPDMPDDNLFAPLTPESSAPGPIALAPDMPSLAPLAPTSTPAPAPLAPASDPFSFEPPPDPAPATRDPPGFHPSPSAPVATSTMTTVTTPDGALDGTWPPIDAPAPLASAPPLAVGGESALSAVQAPEPFADDAPPPPAITTPAAAPTSVTGGAFYAHLASYNDEATALAGWTVLSAQSTELLGGLSPRVVSKDLGARGVFYRLHAGPIGNQADAASLCGRLKARDLYCEVAQLAPGS